ncbi:PAS domain-containing protein [Natronomonas halophila]|uniref:sensor histidine kinase n=1 Tax=Natronomonas halophila TaxID=2747817 RepID=UPI0015B75F39|nr:histidine kinase N-terminal 7TM domain-containing protein [Natronomonas halophila]QLD85473.1 PAS domain-containing protein [Natronomonas halophila]
MATATSWTVLLLVGYAMAAGITASIAAYCFLRRSGRAPRAFGGCMLALVLWSLGAFGRLLAATEVGWYAWTVVMYLGVVSTAVLLFVFAALYTGSGFPLSRWRTGALFAVPGVSMLLLATNGHHGLFFADISLVSFWGMATFTPETGPWFWVHATYNYLLFGAATTLLARFAIGSHRLYRRQTLAVLGGAAIPWVANVTYVFVLGPGVPIDPTPLGFAFGSLLFAYAVFGLGLTDLTPVARSTVIDAIDDAVFVLGEDGRLVDLNPAAEALARGEDPIGRPLDAALPAELPGETDDPQPVTVDGQQRWYQTRELPLDGRSGGTVLLASDLTEQMRRRRQLREQNRRLEEFTRVAAHDLRNPLNAVSGYTELARETGNVDHLEKVDPATDRMEALIDDLLTLGQETRVIEETIPVSLPEAARRAWGGVETGSACLDVVDEGVLLAHEKRFVQLLENLFRNAAAHGGEDVTVRVGMPPNGFFVADDGTGIPTDRRADVFEYGYSTHGGTGLGLPVVRSIAVAHGWTVDVTDADDGGARFEFTDVRVRSGPASEGAIEEEADSRS